jgi:hypothetical protein
MPLDVGALRKQRTMLEQYERYIADRRGDQTRLLLLLKKAYFVQRHTIVYVVRRKFSVDRACGNLHLSWHRRLVVHE